MSKENFKRETRDQTSQNIFCEQNKSPWRKVRHETGEKQLSIDEKTQAPVPEAPDFLQHKENNLQKISVERTRGRCIKRSVKAKKLCKKLQISSGTKSRFRPGQFSIQVKNISFASRFTPICVAHAVSGKHCKVEDGVVSVKHQNATMRSCEECRKRMLCPRKNILFLVWHEYPEIATLCHTRHSK